MYIRMPIYASTNYQQGKIFKVVNSIDDTILIGSTSTRWLSSKMCAYRQAANCKTATPLNVAMNKYGAFYFEIKLIKDYPCENKDELYMEKSRIVQDYKNRGVTLYNR